MIDTELSLKTGDLVKLHKYTMIDASCKDLRKKIGIVYEIIEPDSQWHEQQFSYYKVYFEDYKCPFTWRDFELVKV